MGRQFQIYLLPSDASRLLNTLREKVTVSLFASHSLSSRAVEADSPLKKDAAFAYIDSLLAPDKMASTKLDYIQGQGIWMINTLFSEVIEFSGCHFDQKTLKRGRFFYEPGFYGTQEFEKKSVHFLDWAQTVFRIAKKSLTYHSALDAYVGDDAQQWRSTGGVFVALAIKGKPPILAE